MNAPSTGVLVAGAALVGFAAWHRITRHEATEPTQPAAFYRPSMGEIALGYGQNRHLGAIPHAHYGFGFDSCYEHGMQHDCSGVQVGAQIGFTYSPGDRSAVRSYDPYTGRSSRFDPVGNIREVLD